MASSTRATWMQAWEADLTPSPAAARSAARSAARDAATVEARTRHSRYYSREATARVPLPLEETDEPRQPLYEAKSVTTRKPRWKLIVLAMVFCGLVLGCAIVAPVLINSAATQVESSVGQLEAQQKQLAADTSSLSAQISALSSPDRIAEQADRLGLVPAQSVHYVESGAETAATEGDTKVAGR